MITCPDGRIQYNMHHAPARDQQPFFLQMMRTMSCPNRPIEASPPDINLQMCPPSRPLQTTANPASASERGSTLSATPAREQHMPVPNFLQPRIHVQLRKVAQNKKDILVNLQQYLAAPVRRGLTILFHLKMALACSPMPRIPSTPIPWVSFDVKEYTPITKAPHQEWLQFGFQNHIAAWFNVINACNDQWFKLWHAFDQCKTEPNRRTNRIQAAREVTKIPTPPLTVDNFLRGKIIQNIRPPNTSDALRPWHSQINTLCMLFAKWPQWENHIDFIIAREYDGKKGHKKQILACYFPWTDAPTQMVKQSSSHNCVRDMLQTHRHCKFFTLEELYQLQMRMNEGSRIIGVLHFIVGLMVSILELPWTSKTTWRSVWTQSNTLDDAPKMIIVLSSPMEWSNPDNCNIFACLRAGLRNLPQQCSLMWSTAMRTDGWLEAT